MLVQGMTACFRVLLDYLDAAPDAVDSDGHSAVHWQVFMATSDFSEETIKFKPADERLQAGLETAGVAPGSEESAEPWLWSLFRYRCEPALQLLLNASKQFGYIGGIAEMVAWNASEEAQPSQATSSRPHGRLKRNPSLLDLQDNNGNTALVRKNSYSWMCAERRCRPPNSHSPTLLALLLVVCSAFCGCSSQRQHGWPAAVPRSIGGHQKQCRTAPVRSRRVR